MYNERERERERERNFRFPSFYQIRDLKSIFEESEERDILILHCIRERERVGFVYMYGMHVKSWIFGAKV